MSDRVCIGRCNASQRRRTEEYTRNLAAWQTEMTAWANTTNDDCGPEPVCPIEPTLRWTAGTPIWCLEDSAAIRASLLDLDQQMALRLMNADGYGSISLEERVSSSPEPNSPSPAHDQLDDLVRWLRGWQTDYWKSQGLTVPPYRGESAPALMAVVSLLSAQLDGILAHPEYAEDFGVGVLWWHNQISAAAKTRPRRISKQLRCPQCRLATLSQIEGEDRIECRNRDCGASRGGPMVMTVDEYMALVEAATPARKEQAVALAAQRTPKPHIDYGQLSGRA
ncbi:hypothetical protein [Streptosporangium sp. CA-115845]|uniref:hypothetical protein n=1 Tax=Streptosporangium sp. CA-115845 TaxID=3240071 RepID=UPI003D8C8781